MQVLASLAILAALGGSHTPAPVHHVTGSQGYYYVTAFDDGNSTGHPGENISDQILADGQSISANNDHEITEIYVRDAADNAVEIGVLDDPSFEGMTAPTLVVTSWTRGHYNGLDTSATGFVRTAGPVPGSYRPPAGTWDDYGIVYSGGNVYFTYGLGLSRQTIGYIPGSFWPGGWGGNTEAQTYGEAYNTVNGGTLPTMNGGVRNWNAGGPLLTPAVASSPYEVHNVTVYGFTFDGPH